MRDVYLQKKDIALYSYIYAQTLALAIFALSRSVGHIVKRILITAELPEIWQSLSPISGSINSITFIIFGLVALFYSNVRATADKVDALEKKETELEESEEKYRTLFESAGDSIFIIGPDTGRFIDCNEKATFRLGYTRDELLNLRVVDINPPEDQEVIKSRVERQLRGESLSFETSHRRKDGTYMPIEISSKVIDYGGKKVIQAIVRDITERKKAEEEIKVVNRALKALSRSNIAVIYSKTEKELLGEICKIVVEEGGYKLAWIGYAEDDKEKTVRPVAQAGYEDGYLETLNITWADTERGRGPTGTAIRTGKPHLVKNIHKDPKFVPWREEAVKRGYASSIALPLISNGDTLGALNIYSELPGAFSEEELKLLEELADDLAFGIITLRIKEERKKAEIALKESEARNRAFLNGIPDLIFRINGEGTFLDYKDSRSAKTSVPPEQFIGKKVQDIMPKDIGERSLYHIKRALESDKIQILEYELEMQNVTRIYEARIISSGYDEVLMISRDITDIRRAEENLKNAYEELKTLDKLKTDVISNVSHELKTPITIIKGCLELIEEEEEMEEKIGLAKKAQEALERQQKIIDDLLGLSKLRSGDNYREPLDIVPIMQYVIEQKSAIAEKKDIKIKFEVRDKISSLNADPTKIEQVFRNLLGNAIKFNKKGGDIWIKIKESDNFIEVLIKDTGIGIREEDKDKIFKPLTQLDTSTKREFGGTGAGLAVAKKIVELYNGKISVESKFGEGSTFHIIFPLKERKNEKF